ncbi:hypothetical protein HMPREF1207_02689 [Paenibacillus sp. HGH0039]|nr:hypothetical protein HMPREF1207_02689 [Paenibacillus sp. HGH0039]
MAVIHNPVPLRNAKKPEISLRLPSFYPFFVESFLLPPPLPALFAFLPIKKDNRQNRLSSSLYKLLRSVWKQSNCARALDCCCQHTLILRGSTCYTTRQDFTSFGDKFLKGLDIFVIDMSDLVCCEVANFTALTAFTAAWSEFTLRTLRTITAFRTLRTAACLLFAHLSQSFLLRMANHHRICRSVSRRRGKDPAVDPAYFGRCRFRRRHIHRLNRRSKNPLHG